MVPQMLVKLASAMGCVYQFARYFPAAVSGMFDLFDRFEASQLADKRPSMYDVLVLQTMQNGDLSVDRLQQIKLIHSVKSLNDTFVSCRSSLHCEDVRGNIAAKAAAALDLSVTSKPDEIENLQTGVRQMNDDFNSKSWREYCRVSHASVVVPVISSSSSSPAAPEVEGHRQIPTIASREEEVQEEAPEEGIQEEGEECYPLYETVDYPWDGYDMPMFGQCGRRTPWSPRSLIDTGEVQEDVQLPEPETKDGEPVQAQVPEDQTDSNQRGAKRTLEAESDTLTDHRDNTNKLARIEIPPSSEQVALSHPSVANPTFNPSSNPNPNPKSIVHQAIVWSQEDLFGGETASPPHFCVATPIPQALVRKAIVCDQEDLFSW